MQTKLRTILRIICLLAGLQSCLNIEGAVVDFGELDSRLRSIITNRACSDEDLLQAISHLGPPSESPSFWVQIANDDGYSLKHRSRAVFALFRRHGVSCGDLVSLGKIVSPGKWLQQSSVEVIDSTVNGNYPVEIAEGQDVVRISIFYRDAIYLRMGGRIRANTIRESLGAKRFDAADIGVPVITIGYGDDYDSWQLSKRSR